MDLVARQWLRDLYALSTTTTTDNDEQLVFRGGLQSGFGVVFDEPDFQGRAHLVDSKCCVPVATAPGQHGIRSLIMPPSSSLLRQDDETQARTQAPHADWWIVADTVTTFSGTPPFSLIVPPLCRPGVTPPAPAVLKLVHSLATPTHAKLRSLIRERTPERSVAVLFSRPHFRGRTHVVRARDGEATPLGGSSIRCMLPLGAPTTTLMASDGDNDDQPVWMSAIILPPWNVHVTIRTRDDTRTVWRLDGSDDWHFIDHWFLFLNRHMRLSQMGWKYQGAARLVLESSRRDEDRIDDDDDVAMGSADPTMEWTDDWTSRPDVVAAPEEEEVSSRGLRTTTLPDAASAACCRMPVVPPPMTPHCPHVAHRTDANVGTVLVVVAAVFLVWGLVHWIMSSAHHRPTVERRHFMSMDDDVENDVTTYTLEPEYQ